MKQLTFAVPNLQSEALAEIENLRRQGKITELSCRLLQMLYVMGWDDGFVEFDRHNLAMALGATLLHLEAAMAELEARCFAIFRWADRYEVAELISLSTPTLCGVERICWWQYYRVEFNDLQS